ncbi:hypothetical protein KME66_10915 [Streptomyces sp. YPW6]|uniref:hypothetical protein n=1 Tax=Streptomyces sp. YPW6 TaxID=2840373 RepID=UPI001C0C34BF|nr:hypothetical protein [Streptomyces sp. YPW6]QWQ41468.1 hypothetical protein KME66_10915 [Streptomyces sp. YPW6]
MARPVGAPPTSASSGRFGLYAEGLADGADPTDPTGLADRADRVTVADLADLATGSGVC